ncbi:hypothetical protein [Streptomyces variabilis]
MTTEYRPQDRTEVETLQVGDWVRATGNDTRGHTVTREGVLLVEPKLVTAQDWGRRVKKVRVHIGELGAEPTRSNSLTLWPGAVVDRAPRYQM